MIFVLKCDIVKLYLCIANLPEHRYDAKATGDEGTVAALESEIDKSAAQLWGITDEELKAIQDALREKRV